MLTCSPWPDHQAAKRSFHSALFSGKVRQGREKRNRSFGRCRSARTKKKKKKKERVFGRARCQHNTNEEKQERLCLCLAVNRCISTARMQAECSLLLFKNNFSSDLEILSRLRPTLFSLQNLTHRHNSATRVTDAWSIMLTDDELQKTQTSS